LVLTRAIDAAAPPLELAIGADACRVADNALNGTVIVSLDSNLPTHADQDRRRTVDHHYRASGLVQLPLSQQARPASVISTSVSAR
jgi:hypothetical protein